MYESPINIQELTRDIQQNIQQDLEKKVIESIGKYEIKVDKEELIKALEYDRNQYIKGYNDALNKIRKEVVCLTYYWCEVNPKSVKEDVLEIIDKCKLEG